MTKTLNQYLIESTKTYSYRIKIASDLTDKMYSDLSSKLTQFDVVNISKPKKTPFQKTPLGFNGIENAEVNIIDVEFNYPATPVQLQNIINSIGIDVNRVIIMTPELDDANQKIQDDTEDGTLLTSALPEGDKEANAEYATADVKNADKSNIEYAGPTADKAKTTNDLPQGTKSAMGSVKQPNVPNVKSFAR